MVVRQPSSLEPFLDREGVALLDRLRVEVMLELHDHFLDRQPICVQERVVVGDAVEAEPDRLRFLAPGAPSPILLHEDLDRPVFPLDVRLDLRAGPAPIWQDLLSRRFDQRVIEHLQGVKLLQATVHRLDRPFEVEAEKLVNLPRHRVLHHEEELAILVAHLLRVHDLVAPEDLHALLEEARVLREAPLLQEPLPSFILHAGREATEERADALELHMSPFRLAGERSVNLRDIVARAQGRFHHP
mmetsp:Transcript_5357/g.21211  ORF Transcript_5357/g.21211 Transcript_5357/m.21211 type:complete len:244 (-) Transcript_5357:551-1282(-)